MKSIQTLLFVVAIGLSLTGCIGVGGTVHRVEPTLGKELVDLKSALDSGALTRQEFDQAKAQLLRKATTDGNR